MTFSKAILHLLSKSISHHYLKFKIECFTNIINSILLELCIGLCILWKKEYKFRINLKKFSKIQCYGRHKSLIWSSVENDSIAISETIVEEIRTIKKLFWYFFEPKIIV
jgi:hypothetical protein